MEINERRKKLGDSGINVDTRASRMTLGRGHVHFGPFKPHWPPVSREIILKGGGPAYRGWLERLTQKAILFLKSRRNVTVPPAVFPPILFVRSLPLFPCIFPPLRFLFIYFRGIGSSNTNGLMSTDNTVTL